jgi:hypothetical protein
MSPMASSVGGVREGFDTFRHFWLTVAQRRRLFHRHPARSGRRSSPVVSYAHATQSAKTVEEQDGLARAM